MAIRQLRQILGDRARTPRFIETVYGRGYRFIAPVTASPDRPQREEARPFPLSATCIPPCIFVGREAALVRVQQWWTTVRQGQRQIGSITGEHGIGDRGCYPCLFQTLTLTAPTSTLSRNCGGGKAKGLRYVKYTGLTVVSGGPVKRRGLPC